jgi:hypothetical protein
MKLVPGSIAPEPRLEPGHPDPLAERGMEGHPIKNTKVHD